MSKIESFRELLVWQKSMDFAVQCYRATQRFAEADQMVLGYQLRKSSVSMPSNIAEGASRHSTPHYIQHLWTAHASGAELETQVELARRLELVSPNLADRLIGDAQELIGDAQENRAHAQRLVRALEQSKSEVQGRGSEA
jgi:four helix bundle protein